MCRLIERNEALRRIKALEQQAAERGRKSDALCYVRAYNAIMSCRACDRKKEKGQGGTEPCQGN